MDISIALNNDDDEFVTRTSSFFVLPQSREFNVKLLLFSVLLRVKCVCLCVFKCDFFVRGGERGGVGSYCYKIHFLMTDQTLTTSKLFSYHYHLNVASNIT